MAIKTKRIYEPVSASDGYRILIDRLWPRGIKKEAVNIDKWLKDIAPSTSLRNWIHRMPEKWDQFIIEYHDELKGSAALEELLADVHKHKIVTLLYAAKNEERNHALVLRQFVTEQTVEA
jgi:uncharacterized protein YeaO (DUF488 family)